MQRMKRNIAFIWGICVLFSIPGCDKDGASRIDDYFVEFATALKDGTSVKFQLDNDQILTPDVAGSFSDKADGQRVVLNYTPKSGGVVKINSASDIFTALLRTDNFPSEYFTDPVKIQSLWVGGKYLNMIAEVEYHDIRHSAALFLPQPSKPNELYFSYSRNGDGAGYPRKIYLSFSLDELKKRTAGTSPYDFVVYVNTSEGMRAFNLQLK